MKNDIVLFGIQGCGKGTQARRLCKDYHYVLFEAGAELRAIAASGTELGQTVKATMDAGHLVPHEIIMRVVEEAIRQRPSDQRILFDGIPRDALQQADFDRIMQSQKRTFRCLHLELDRTIAFDRILGRAQQEGRSDDSNAAAIHQRMDVFTQKTLPVIASYRAQGLVTDINGLGTVDEVYERIVEAVIRDL